jgi:hypothetical protein
MPSTLSPEPIEGNSLTRYLRSMNNTLGQSGADTFKTGQSDYGKGMQDFGPSLDYWNSILSGDKSKMESAIAPEKADILSQYRAKRKQLAATGSRSGGTNEAVAQSEFSQAGDVASLLQKLRPQAAKESSGIAAEIAKLGLNESEVGNAQMFATLQSLLQGRGQDVQQDAATMSMIGDIGKGVGSVLAAYISKPGG